jgi:hypothetical protein
MPNFTRHWDEGQDDTNSSGTEVAGLEGLPDAAHPVGGLSSAAPDISTPTAPSSTSRQKTHRESTAEEQYEDLVNRATGRKTDSLEVWFAGAHTGWSRFHSPLSATKKWLQMLVVVRSQTTLGTACAFTDSLIRNFR